MAILVGAFLFLPAADAAELIAEADAGREVLCVAFSPDGSEVATGSRSNNFIKIWSTATGELIRNLKSHEGNGVYGVCYSPDGSLLASAGRDRTVRLWYVGTGKQLCILRGHTQPVRGVAFSIDGRYLVSCSEDGTAKIWRVRDGKLLETVPECEAALNCLAVSSDDKWFATAGDDLKAKLYEMPTGNWIRTFKKPVLKLNSVAFSPDCSRLACAGDEGEIYFFDVATGRFLKKFGRHSWGGKTYWVITSLCYFPDGRHIVSGAADGTAKIWDAMTGEMIHTIRAHVGGVRAVAISPDGKYLATVGCSQPVQAMEGYALYPVWGRTDKNTLKIWDAESALFPLACPKVEKPAEARVAGGR